MESTKELLPLKTVGRAETVTFIEYDLQKVPARIDTGARLSSVWASDIVEHDGVLSFVFLGPQDDLHTGARHTTTDYELLAVSSSMGHIQKRYKVKFLIKLKGKKIRASFTLADRSSQVYPVLIGRNILKGKFVVDVSKGKVLRRREQEHFEALQSTLNDDRVKK